MTIIHGIGRCVLGILLIVCMLTGASGCTRAFYRKWTDREVNDVLAEKDKYPEWKLEQYHVYPDPRSRFADPTNPDHTPMPPDDEAAWKLSPHPQQPGHAGVGNVQGTAYLEMIKLWDEQNRMERQAAQEKEGPPNLEKRPIKSYFDEPVHAAQKGFLLNLDQAVELGVINSPQYQTFREELYQAALPVTEQRFSFAYQWAALSDFFRQWAGPESGHTNNWTGNSAIGFTKLFSTGALLTLGFANNTVINLAGSRGVVSNSTINLDFVQPFLQGGGKAVTLEPLTQAERDLFYSLRAFARFREQFYVSVAIGSNLPNTLAAASGGSTGPISVLAALGIASTDVAGGFVGYLSTLYRECDLAADKKYVYDLQRALRILEGYQEGGMFSPLQVDQVRSTLLNAQNTVLGDTQFVNNGLDQFKLVLGLPANIPLILDDTPARPITRQLDRYYEVIDDSDAVNRLVEKQETLAAEKLRPFLLELYTKSFIVRGTQFQKKLPVSWANWEKLTEKEVKDRILKLVQERRDLLDLKTDLELKNQTLSPKDAARLVQNGVEADLGSLELELRSYEARPWEKLGKGKEEQAQKERIKAFRFVAHLAKDVLVWVRNERLLRVSTLWPTPPAAALDGIDLLTANVDTAQQVAVQAALTNRWDLMNARAQTVDAWRQLRVTANALLGVFNVGYHLESFTPPDGSRPLAFSSARTTQQLHFNISPPFNRLVQRNAYRSALITYQQARRRLMTLEDNVAVQVRFDVRQLQLFADNYRIQKRTLQSLYSQVENALEVIVAPVDPDSLKSGSTAGQANAAALTNQYLGALSSLNNAQVKMYDIWLSLLATRMQLYLDLERLPLDQRGLWIDDTAAAMSGAAPVPVADLGVAEPENVHEVRPALLLAPVETQP